MASLQDGVQNLEVWRVGMKMLNLVTQMKDPGAPLFTVKFPVLKQKVLLRFGEAQRRLSPSSPLVWDVEHDGNVIPGVTNRRGS